MPELEIPIPPLFDYPNYEEDDQPWIPHADFIPVFWKAKSVPVWL